VFNLQDQLISAATQLAYHSQRIARAELIEFASDIDKLLAADLPTPYAKEGVQLLLIACDVDDPKTTAQEAELLKQAAQAKGTLVISYDVQTTSLNQLLSLIALKL